MARTAACVPLSGGVVVTKYGHGKGPIPGIDCYEAGHPVPDENSFRATEAASAAGESDVSLLAHCVYGEARGEPYVGKVAVAAVVLNRVRSSSFPNTISGVIYQEGAFTCVSDGQLYLTPDEDAYRAARDALNGWDPTYGCLYYYNPATAVSAWIWSREVRLTIGAHSFAV